MVLSDLVLLQVPFDCLTEALTNHVPLDQNILCNNGVIEADVSETFMALNAGVPK